MPADTKSKIAMTAYKLQRQGGHWKIESPQDAKKDLNISKGATAVFEP